MVIASVQSQARESNEIMTLHTPAEVIVHRGEISEVFFTTHNTADSVQTFTANIENVSSDLSITGLPLNYTLVENHLKQLKGISIPKMKNVNYIDLVNAFVNQSA